MLETITEKKCTKCKETKPFNCFNKQKDGKYGYRPTCKKCFRNYIESNKEKISHQQKIYRQINKITISLKEKEYRQLNQESILNNRKRYYEENKEIILANRGEYKKTQKGKVVNKNSCHKRRTAAINGNVTSKQLLELQENAKVCYWCNTLLKNKTVHIDHYIPVSKGGEHTISNLVVSCQTCNLSKGAKDPVEFANKMGKLL